ncbi:MAG: carboxypeptidase-like regulatory domain-containing protein, partial [Acidobacteriota bacterium]|nr:carboxypeptidase-like regulatory domain-containing protein [Acidobacteriota bacterium]
MSRFVRFFLALSVLAIGIVLVPGIQAQTTAAVEGVVTDGAGIPVAGAELTVKDPATGLERTATTDDEGRYRLTALPPALYRVVAMRDGQVSPIIEQRLPIGQTVRLDMRMQDSRTEEVVVRAR